MEEEAAVLVAGGFTCFYCLFIVCAVVVGLGATVLWIWMLVDCATKEKEEGNTKLVWVLIILFAQGIGALIYLIVRRPQRLKELGQ